MDILNFISWIKGGRVVTTVDPTQTLLPVGLKDSRRDDGYLAGAISVEDFANQVGGLQTVAVDGVTITGDGTPGDPLVATPPSPPVAPYKVFTALITQTGTNNPTLTVLENTLGQNLTFVRVSQGFYAASFAQYITPNQVFFSLTSGNIKPVGVSLFAVYTFAQGFTISSYANYTGAFIGSVGLNDFLLDNTYLEIRVYP